MDNVKKNEATPQPERAAGLPEQWKEAAAIYREQGRNDIADVFDDCAYALARQQSRMADKEWTDRIAALQAQGEAVAWTDDQCTEFACVAFRHAPKNLPEGVTLQDIRLGAARVIRMAAAPPSDVLRRVVEALEAVVSIALRPPRDVPAECDSDYRRDGQDLKTLIPMLTSTLAAAHKALAEGVDRG